MSLRYSKKVAAYRFRLALRYAMGPLISTHVPDKRAALPSVTIFISNHNTRHSLELAIESLEATTDYPGFQLWLADNGSSDGSWELLSSLDRPYAIKLFRAEAPILHGAWLDRVAAEVETDYWVAVDSDMLFTSKGWLWDMVRRMEGDSSLFLLAAEPLPCLTSLGLAGGAARAEGLSSWLFCVRTKLWPVLGCPTFQFDEHVDGRGNHTIYDTGARLLQALTRTAYNYGVMPRWFTFKYYHFGNMSWFKTAAGGDDVYRDFKEYQRRDVQRRLKREGRRGQL